MGKYIVTARRKDINWYIGGMTNWDTRSTEVNLSFLKDNVSYQATIFKDAPNSYEQPKEYMVEKRTVDNKTVLNIDMAKGGGFVVRLEAQ